MDVVLLGSLRFSIAHPGDWTEVPGDHAWSLAEDTDWLNAAADVFFTPLDEGVRVSGWSVPVDIGLTLEAWLNLYCWQLEAESTNPVAECLGFQDGSVATSMDGHPGLLLEGPGEVQAYFLVDEHVYGFVVWRSDDDASVAKYSGARRLLGAYLSTVRLLPAGPTPTLDLGTWTQYNSPRYGFHVAHPPGWTEVPADHDWTLANDADNWLSTGQEVFFTEAGDGVRVSAWSVVVDPATAAESWAPGPATDAWIEAYCEAMHNDDCSGAVDRAVRTCFERRDCHPGFIVSFENDVQAFCVAGDRMFIVAVWYGQRDPALSPYGGARQLLKGFTSTIGLGSVETTPPAS